MTPIVFINGLAAGPLFNLELALLSLKLTLT